LGRVEECQVVLGNLFAECSGGVLQLYCVVVPKLLIDIVGALTRAYGFLPIFLTEAYNVPDNQLRQRPLLAPHQIACLDFRAYGIEVVDEDEGGWVQLKGEFEVLGDVGEAEGDELMEVEV
jgi:hypothetical protein